MISAAKEIDLWKKTIPDGPRKKCREALPRIWRDSKMEANNTARKKYPPGLFLSPVAEENVQRKNCSEILADFSKSSIQNFRFLEFYPEEFFP